MPWKECKPMDERLRFIARLLDGEKMAVVCREFGISRKIGYKLFNRYKEHGIRGLEDRGPKSLSASQQAAVRSMAILRIKREYPSFGAPPRSVRN